jgi:hypothetical protein
MLSTRIDRIRRPPAHILIQIPRPAIVPDGISADPAAQAWMVPAIADLEQMRFAIPAVAARNSLRLKPNSPVITCLQVGITATLASSYLLREPQPVDVADDRGQPSLRFGCAGRLELDLLPWSKRIAEFVLQHALIQHALARNRQVMKRPVALPFLRIQQEIALRVARAPRWPLSSVPND